MCIRRYNHIFFSPKRRHGEMYYRFWVRSLQEKEMFSANLITLWFSNDEPAGCLRSLRGVGAQGSTVREPMAKKVWGLVRGEQKKTTLQITAAELWNVSDFGRGVNEAPDGAKKRWGCGREDRRWLCVHSDTCFCSLLAHKLSVERRQEKLWGPQNLKFTPPKKWDVSSGATRV